MNIKFSKRSFFMAILFVGLLENLIVQAADSDSNEIECLVCRDTDKVKPIIGFPVNSGRHWYHSGCLRKSIESTRKEEGPYLPGVDLDEEILSGVGLPIKGIMSLGEGELYQIVSGDFERPVSAIQFEIRSSAGVIQDAEERGYQKAMAECIGKTAIAIEGDVGDWIHKVVYNFKEPIGELHFYLRPSAIFFDQHNAEIEKLKQRIVELERSQKNAVKKPLLAMRSKKVVPYLAFKNRGFGINMLHEKLNLK